MHAALQRVYEADLAEHGAASSIGFPRSGWKDFGPVDDDFGGFEHGRIGRAVLSIRTRGFLRERGVPAVYVLKRDLEFRLLVRGGVHRIAALDALGYTHIPVQPLAAWPIDVEDARYWHNVRSGHWSEHAAVRYLTHLFDCDTGAALRTRLAPAS
ncbi:MAG: hypothetical protein ACXIU8_15975 [Alkalilacustris sp.]